MHACYLILEHLTALNRLQQGCLPWPVVAPSVTEALGVGVSVLVVTTPLTSAQCWCVVIKGYVCSPRANFVLLGSSHVGQWP